MNFIIKIPINGGWTFNIIQAGDAEIQNERHKVILKLETSKKDESRIISVNNTTYCLAGDFIIPEGNMTNIGKYLQDFFSDFEVKKLRESRGNFYLIIINEKEQQVQIMGSMMSIFPVYYYRSHDQIIVSSRADAIIKDGNQQFRINKKYILEHLMFGYGFQDSTLYKDIKLLPANYSIKIKAGTFSYSPHTSVTDYFVSEPIPWRQSVERLSDLFIDRAKDYLPNEPYFTSFTGGLDGRTVLALGLSRGKNMTAYSYGTEFEKDVTIPSSICKKISLPYKPFILDNDYAEKYFFNDAQAANQITEGNLRFSRATYLLMAREISKNSDYMLTGNFGSELMRTFHMPGNMISSIIFDMFESVSDMELAQRIRESPRLRCLAQESHEKELEEITEECIDYRNYHKKTLSLNQRFYRYIFEEVYRKYFGPELILENNFLVNRTPFLDFVFFREVLKSELAGCNAEYKTNNPFDRFKGQALYPHIIRKTYPLLLKDKLDREYSPADFLTVSGKTKIAYGFIIRKLFVDRDRYGQPAYNRIAVKRNIEKLNSNLFDYPFVNKEHADRFFTENLWEKDYINFNIFVTLTDYLRYVLKTYENVSF